MADGTSIEWTDATWNPIRARNRATGKIGWHCEHATPGCEFCYAEGFNKRLGTGLPFKPGHRKDVEIFLDEKMLTLPLSWKRPRMIFVCSMTDLFADFVRDEWIDRVFAVMALCPQHRFQVLTKRAKRMHDWVSERLRPSFVSAAAISMLQPVRSSARNMGWALPNVWLGVSAEDQERADERIPDLLATPAAVRFVSLEPLLGAIDMTNINHWNALNGNHWGTKLDWVIVGGESGPRARPMHPDWARSIRDQCAAAGVPYFFKQWGEWAHEGQCEANGRRILWPIDCEGSNKIGKRAAGRLLDGIEHNAMPGATI